MNWQEITIHTTEEATEMVSNFFHEAGAEGVSIEESGTLNKNRDTSYGQWFDAPLNDIPEGEAVIKGYFYSHENLPALIGSLRESVEGLRQFGIEIGRASVEVKEVREEDWAHAWKQYYKPVRVSERITVKPSWEALDSEDVSDIVIELDPGMAFGTGTHETTTLCLKSLEKVIVGGEDVMDIGTGSGILAVAAARLGARHVLALDLDPVAVSSARENVEMNGLGEQITVRQSDLLHSFKSGGRRDGGEGGHPGFALPEEIAFPVRVVVANILAEVILTLLEDVHAVLETNGLFIASGIIENKEKEVEAALKAARFEIVEKLRDQSWVAFIARKWKVGSNG